MRTLLPDGWPAELAIALSGGPDSTALALLARAWAADADVRLHALTVDHGLRAQSAAEARQVASWCAAHQLAHVILRWPGPPPVSGVQAAAREARYRLLRSWCQERGICHLLLAHQRDDQVETMLLRLQRGSGPVGAAGMSASAERDGLTLLRPLLASQRAELLAFLARRHEVFIEDPGNRDPRFARVLLRQTLLAAGSSGLTERLAAAALAFGRLRQGWVAALAEACTLVAADALGYLKLELAGFRALPEPLQRRLLAHLVRCLGGNKYLPSARAAERARARLSTGQECRLTLGGCLLRTEGAGLLLLREGRGLPPPLALPPGKELRWDRFVIARGTGDRLHGLVTATALGARAWRGALAGADMAPLLAVPAVARPGLLAIDDERGLAGLPQLGLWRAELGRPAIQGRFLPLHAVMPDAFVIVC